MPVNGLFPPPKARLKHPQNIDKATGATLQPRGQEVPATDRTGVICKHATEEEKGQNRPG